MFQESEIVNLLIGCASIPVLVHLGRRVWLPAGRLLYASFALVLAAYLFTVVEGVIWAAGFNFLEHLCETLAGIGFCIATWRLARAPADGDANR